MKGASLKQPTCIPITELIEKRRRQVSRTSRSDGGGLWSAGSEWRDLSVILQPDDSTLGSEKGS